ncbi:MAG: porin [Thiotrichales bacterium]|nr:porin [Thiotrichales bacterium]
MKKTLLVASLATLFATPSMANNTLYGDFRASLNTGDLNGADNNAKIENNASRFGLKGSQGNDGLKAIYHLEMGANNDSNGDALTARFYFAGLEGSMGKLIYGRMSTPYKMTGVAQDPFYDTSAGAGNAGSNYGYSSLINGFTDNSFAYYSPSFGGLSFNASASIDDSAEDNHAYAAGIQYKAGGFTAGVNHMMIDDTATSATVAGSDGLDSATRVYAGMKMGAFGVNASYEMLEKTAGGDDATLMNVNATFKMSSALTAAASYGKVEDGIGTSGLNASGDNITAGIFYNVLPKTTVHALYTNTDYDAAAVADRDGVAIGVKQMF